MIISIILDNSHVMDSYDGFIPWLIKYKEACEDNPGCKIRASI